MELREWQYINKPSGSAANNSSSSGYKKRFEKLIKYHIDHASSELESITRKDISNWYFRLIEHYNTGSQEFDRNIIVSVDKATGTFYLNIFVDGKQVYHNDYKSYEEVLEILTDTYMFLPDAGTPEYDDLLTESLNEWKYANPPKASQSTNQRTQPAQATSANTGFKKRLDKLVKYHGQNLTADVYYLMVSLLTKDRLEFFEQCEEGLVEYKISIDPSSEAWQVKIFINKKLEEDIKGTGWQKLLATLRPYIVVPEIKDSEYKDLLTESLAKDFEVYDFFLD